MPRLRQVPKAEAEAPIVTTMYDFLFEGRDPVAEPGTWTGSSGDWWTVFALVPDVLEHAVAGFGLYQSPKRRLNPILRELGQIRAGWAAGSQFVFSQHCKSLRDLGVAEEKIQSIPTWSVATCRVFRPPQIFRILEPVAGLPRITIRMRPTNQYGKPLRQRSLGCAATR